MHGNHGNIILPLPSKGFNIKRPGLSSVQCFKLLHLTLFECLYTHIQSAALSSWLPLTPFVFLLHTSFDFSMYDYERMSWFLSTRGRITRFHTDIKSAIILIAFGMWKKKRNKSSLVSQCRFAPMGSSQLKANRTFSFGVFESLVLFRCKWSIWCQKQKNKKSISKYFSSHPSLLSNYRLHVSGSRRSDSLWSLLPRASPGCLSQAWRCWWLLLALGTLGVKDMMVLTPGSRHPTVPNTAPHLPICSCHLCLCTVVLKK